MIIEDLCQVTSFKYMICNMGRLYLFPGGVHAQLVVSSFADSIFYSSDESRCDTVYYQTSNTGSRYGAS